MADEIMNTHPVLQMLNDNEPETLEYWLCDDGLTRLSEDFENGRINGPTYQQRLQAWVAAWRKRLEDWQNGNGNPTQHDAHILSAHVWVKPGIPAKEGSAIPQHLQPQKARAKTHGPRR